MRFRAKFTSNGIPFPVAKSKVEKKAVGSNGSNNVDGKPVWLPMCYHRDFIEGIKEALCTANRDPVLHEFFLVAFNRKMPVIRPAWTCDEKRLWQEIRGSNVLALTLS